MEDSGLNLMAGIVVGAILIMGLAYTTIYAPFNSMNNMGTISDSYGAMSTQEKDAFNNQFAAYEGTQSGAQVKALISTLISNANIYQDEVEKIPSFLIADKINKNGDELKDAISDDINEYIENLNLIRNALETKHTYTITMYYSENGIIDEISIYYEEQ